MTNPVVSFGETVFDKYDPAEVTIFEGDTVTWKGDLRSHPLVSDGEKWPTPNTGKSFPFHFVTPGEYPYHSKTNPEMKGKIIVNKAGGAATK